MVAARPRGPGRPPPAGRRRPAASRNTVDRLSRTGRSPRRTGSRWWRRSARAGRPPPRAGGRPAGSAEPVHLVEEQDRAPVVSRVGPGGAGDDLPYVPHARGHRRERHEVPVGGRCFTTRPASSSGAGRALQDHRRQPVGLDPCRTNPRGLRTGAPRRSRSACPASSPAAAADPRGPDRRGQSGRRPRPGGHACARRIDGLPRQSSGSTRARSRCRARRARARGHGG